MKQLTNWSYSRYGTWKKCPAILKFDSTSTAPRTMHPAAERGVGIHKVFEDYLLRTREDLPQELAYYQIFLNNLREAGAKPELQLAVDVNWKVVPWDDPNRWWRGVLDAVVHQGNNAIVYDWKTGQEYPDHREQREIYAATYFALEPVNMITAIHVYTDKKQNTFTVFHRHEAKSLQKKWEGRVAPMLADTRFVANPGYYCRSCRHSRDNGGPCPF